jgi:O-antigen ligase/tetratricopeptide (TPR) repeat protein
VHWRQKIGRIVQQAMEIAVLVMVCVSPWYFGAVEPIHECWLYWAVAALVLLWGVRILLQGEVRWKKCPVLLCLGALFLLSLWQLQALPTPVLRTLSPKTVELDEALLPSEPEQLPFGEHWERPQLAAGSSVSLYPGATRLNLMRLLAVFMLFAVVRNNIASPASLRRLDIALVANGTLLSLFAFIQFFTSAHNTVYWTYTTQGSVFGPFVCRTHFPYYVNVSIGAALGLLLSRSSRQGKRRREQQRENWLDSFQVLLEDPARLWLCCALAMMVGAVLLSLARGGIIALLAASVLTVVLCRRKRSFRSSWVGPTLVGAASVLALVAWLGLDRVESRLSTIWKGEAIESRLPLWTDSWPLVGDFPLLGTGLGTFAYVEPLHREHTSSTFIHEHAHNEYLEALIEGGIPRLLISLLAVGLIFYFGYRAVRQHRGHSAWGLAVGALFGFTAQAVHNFGDFGYHLPAIAVLATVLCAQLVTLGMEDVPAADSEAVAEPPKPPAEFVLRAWGVAPWIAAMTAVLIGLTLWTEGRRLEHVQILRLNARSLQGSGNAERALFLLEEAARLAPGYANLRSELGQAHLDVFEKANAQLNQGLKIVQAAGLVLVGAPTPTAPLPLAWAQPDSITTAWAAGTVEQQREIARQHLVPALRAYLEARDLCPLLSRPQIRIAANLPYFAKAEPRTVYLDRAKRLVTNDHDLWFLFGLQELVEGKHARAAQSWHRALELSDNLLPSMVQMGQKELGSEVFLSEVLPDKPALLVRAAELLFPGPNSVEQQRPFLEKAQRLLRDQPGELTADQWHLRARVDATFGQLAEAQEAYHTALQQAPTQTGWRLEYAVLLHSMGRLAEARRQVVDVLRTDPRQPQALELLRSIDNALRETPRRAQ